LLTALLVAATIDLRQHIGMFADISAPRLRHCRDSARAAFRPIKANSFLFTELGTRFLGSKVVASDLP
jgi:hypothetical protein